MQRLKEQKKEKTRYGDTIVEAVIAIAIYSIVAVLALASMNSGLKSAQKNLESSMSRALVDSQADTIRYIYENYILSRNQDTADSDFYGMLWNDEILAKYKNQSSSDADRKNLVHGLDSVSSCDELLRQDGGGTKKYFALNGRALYSPSVIKNSELGDAGFLEEIGSSSIDAADVIFSTIIDSSRIETANLYPRIIYKPLAAATDDDDNKNFSSILIGSNEGAEDIYRPSRNVQKAQGVWIVFVQEERSDTEDVYITGHSYDFYVRTCWNAAGEKSPSSFTTVVRLFKVD